MTRRTRLFAASGLLLLAALGGACGGDDGDTDASTPETTADAPQRPSSSGAGSPANGSEGAAETSAISIKDFKFEPKTAKVKAGESVTWTNEDASEHSVVDKGGAFKSDEFGAGKGDGTFTHTFDKAGTYPYFCGVHEYMTGTVTVT